MTEIIYERKAKDKEFRYLVTRETNGFFVWETSVQIPVFRFIGWGMNSSQAIDYARDVAEGRVTKQAHISALENP